MKITAKFRILQKVKFSEFNNNDYIVIRGYLGKDQKGSDIWKYDIGPVAGKGDFIIAVPENKLEETHDKIAKETENPAISEEEKYIPEGDEQ